MAVEYDFTVALPDGVTVTGANGASVTWTAGVGFTATGTATTPPCIKVTDNRMSGGWQQMSNTDTNVWLVLEMSTTSGTWAGVYDLPAGQFIVYEGDMKTYSLPIKADGAFYKYNRALGDYYAIPRTEAHTQVATAADPVNAAVTAGTLSSKGKLTKFNSKFVNHGDGPIIWLNEVRGTTSTGVLKSLKIADKPEGSANLVCEVVSPAEAMHRIGSPGLFGMRVHNLGGASASRFKFTWTDTNGLAYVASSFRMGDRRSRIRPGEDRTFYWSCTPSGTATTGAASFKTGTVELTCAQGSTTGVIPVRSWADPTLASIVSTVGTIPQGSYFAPVPMAASDVIVECYYFPVWYEGGYHVSSIVSSFDRRPFVGYASEGMPDGDWATATPEERTASLKMFEAEVKLAVDHGIDRWVVEWFVNTRPQNEGFLNSIKNASNKDDIEWFICYVNSAAGADGKSNVSCWVGAIDTPNGVVFVGSDTAPVNAVGAAGSFHYNRSNARLYGPKPSAGSWGDISLPANYVQAPAGTPDADIYYCANWLHHFEEVIPNFSLSNYTRINNKPRYDFLAVESQQHWYAGLYKQVTADDSTGQAVHTTEKDAWVASLLDRANTMAVAAGYAGMEWGGGAAHVQRTFWAGTGMIHTCSYNWHFYVTPCNVRTALHAQEIGANQVWPGFVSNNTYNAGIFAALTTTTGFNHERWSGRLYTPEAMVTGWTYEIMKDHIGDAFAKVRTRPEIVAGVKRRVIRLSAWNENGEDSSMQPIARNQYTFLRALYEVRSGNTNFPVVVTPEEHGITLAPMSTVLWAQFPTANPVADGTQAVTTQGVNTQHRLYETYEMEPCRTVIGRGST